jgi:polysaccharide pyruvyl transferase WcaK-like protein
MTHAPSKLVGGLKVLVRTATTSGDDPRGARDRRFAMTRKRDRRIAPQRIALFGLFGCGNSGNDGSLEAMLTFLRQARPEAELACICGAPDKVTRDFGLRAIPFSTARPAHSLPRLLDRLLLRGPRRLASFVRAIGHARNWDVLIIPGTGILDDFGEGPSGIPLALFKWCLGAMLCRSRIAFVSIGAGPIHHPVSRWLMKSAVTMAHYRSYRDTISKAFMQSIGFNAQNDAVYPDIAFKLPAPPSIRREDTKDGPLAVGVGVMTYYGWRNDRTRGASIYQAYLEKIANFMLWLLDRGHPVRILMGDVADQRAVADLTTKLTTARPNLPQDRLLTNPVYSLHDLMRQIAETDVVVATRFHNIVCALKMGKPTLSVGYAEKNDVLMAEMGMGGFCQHIEQLDLGLLIEQFSQLISDRRSYEQRIREMNLVYQERLQRQDWLLAASLL